MNIEQAIILCGGKGTRLGLRARYLPKPLFPVGGQPVLDHIMDTLQAAGINKFILAAGYLGDVIKSHYHTNLRMGCSIEVVIEPEPRGTAGALRYISDMLDDNFVLAYGDVFIDFDVLPMIARHARHELMGTLLVRASDHPWDSHLIEQDKTGVVVKFIHERLSGQLYYNVANAAFYILNKAIASYIPTDKVSDFGADVFPAVLQAGLKLRTYSLPEEGFVKDMGTPDRLSAVDQYLRERALARKAAAAPKPITTVLLDRDGVLNADSNLIASVEQLELLPGAATAIALLTRAGIHCYVITNQPVIARGLCTVQTLELIHARLMNELTRVGGKLDGIYYCPHHPETHHAGGVPELRCACRCRKPAPGLIFKAQHEHGFDLATAVMVGDRATDVRAGKAAGIRTVLIGHEKSRRIEATAVKPDAQYPSLLAFAEAVIKKNPYNI